MKLPDFLIVGAAKSGTTSLFYYLRQHPQIYMPKCKETNFFSFEGEEINFRGPGDDLDTNRFSITRIEDYQLLFRNSPENCRLGEASPSYLYCDKAPRRIRTHIPKAKIVTILRNPISRAYSNYLHLSRSGRETLTFREAIQAVEDRMAQNWQWFWDYIGIGLYHQQISRYLENFDSSQLKIVLYDDFLYEPDLVIADIFRFIGVESSFKPNRAVRYNTGGVSKNGLVGSAIRKIVSNDNPIKKLSKMMIPTQYHIPLATVMTNLNKKEEKISASDKQFLLDIYKDEIEKLQELLGRDLSMWLV